MFFEIIFIGFKNFSEGLLIVYSRGVSIIYRSVV